MTTLKDRMTSASPIPANSRRAESAKVEAEDTEERERFDCDNEGERFDDAFSGGVR